MSGGTGRSLANWTCLEKLARRTDWRCIEKLARGGLAREFRVGNSYKSLFFVFSEIKVIIFARWHAKLTLLRFYSWIG